MGSPARLKARVWLRALRTVLVLRLLRKQLFCAIRMYGIE